MEYKKTFEYWIRDDYFDEETKKELLNIESDENEIKERFHKELEFGTGGLRGILGAGSNRVNIYTVRKVTQGLANYILSQKYLANKKISVCIAYDSRKFSDILCETAALVLNANDIKTYVFDSLRPTPQLSFALRELGCVAGIVITASHNPPEYNGYKIYWEDGSQVQHPRDLEIIKFVNQINDYKQIKNIDKNNAINKGLFCYIDKKIDEDYIDNVIKQSINLNIIKKHANNVKIVYTPIHGSGNLPVRAALKKIGFTEVFVVKEQELPDPDFSTVKYPNPEDPDVYEIAIDLAKNIDADIIIGTDPDCDRVGIVIKSKDGKYINLNGNMIGILISDYIVSQKKKDGTLSPNHTLISTIVSTNMTKEIAIKNGIKYIEVLTGFKYIGEKIKEFEKSDQNIFLFGFEESYGYLAGTYTRDKDAVVASMLLCEIVAFYKDKNMDLLEALDELYQKYGYFKEITKSITLKGLDGIENINKIMLSLRSMTCHRIGDLEISKIFDYKYSVETDTKTKISTKINFPSTDALKFILNNESWIGIRPSGTEPKIKIYFAAKSDSKDNIDEILNKNIEFFMKAIDNI